MKKFINLCLVSLLVISCCLLNGCKKKDFSVYIFSSTGGSITINDSKDRIEYKETLYLNKKTEITFTAHADDGYVLDYWEINSEPDSSNSVISLEISKETVVKAVFKDENDVTDYLLTFLDENNAKIGSTLEIEDGEMFRLPAVESREGYKAVFVDMDNVNNILDPATASQFAFNYRANKTFKLQYISTSQSATQEHTIKFLDENNVEISSYTIAEGATIVMPDASKYTIPNGYDGKFVDSVDNLTEVGTTYNWTTDKTFVLKLVAKSYTINFVENQFQTYIPSITATFNTAIDLPDNVKDGYSAKYFYGTNEIKDGDIYSYAQNITINVVLTDTKHTITFAQSTYYSLVLENGYDWTVIDGGSVKFKVDLAYATLEVSKVVLSSGQELVADSNRVYTINNVNQNETINVEVIAPIMLTYSNLDSSALDLFNFEIVTNDYSSKNSNYFVKPGSTFEFKLTSNLAGLTYNCYINGALAIDNNGTYTFTVDPSIVNNISVTATSTLDYEFGFGEINGVKVENNTSTGSVDLIGKIYKNTNNIYYYTYNSDIEITLTNSQGTKKQTLAEWVEEYNSRAIQQGYRVSAISAYNPATLDVKADWCKIDYTTVVPTFSFTNEFITINNLINSDKIELTLQYQRMGTSIDVNYGEINNNSVKPYESGYLELILDATTNYYIVESDSKLVINNGTNTTIKTLEDIVNDMNNNNAYGTSKYRVKSISLYNPDSLDLTNNFIQFSYATNNSILTGFICKGDVIRASDVNNTTNYEIIFVWEQYIA